MGCQVVPAGDGRGDNTGPACGMAWCDGTDHITVERRISPVPLPLLGFAMEAYGHKNDGQLPG